MNFTQLQKLGLIHKLKLNSGARKEGSRSFDYEVGKITHLLQLPIRNFPTDSNIKRKAEEQNRRNSRWEVAKDEEYKWQGSKRGYTRTDKEGKKRKAVDNMEPKREATATATTAKRTAVSDPLQALAVYGSDTEDADRNTREEKTTDDTDDGEENI